MLSKVEKAFRGQYMVRRLTEADSAAVLKLYRSNVDYYAIAQNHPVSEEDCVHDRTECPPGISEGQKYYLGFYREGFLIAVMDFVDGYPDTEIVYIGLFMIDRHFHGKGVGTGILLPFLAAMKACGFQKAALGCFESNTAGKGFWTRLGFTVDEIVDRTEEETTRRLMKMSLRLNGR